MLILSRKKNEGLTITPSGLSSIRVVVVEIKGDKVRLGFDASRDVQIVRDDAIQKEHRDADQA
jgi:carbon storage regulator